LNIIITLAGKSFRFFSEGYKKDKFLLPTYDNKIVLEHVVEMFSPDDKFHFIISKKQSKIKGLKNKISGLTKRNTIHEIEDHNKGPVHSIIKINDIDKNEPIIISYCDFFVKWDYKRFLRNSFSSDGAIPVFKGFHPSSLTGTLYAYIKSDKKNSFLSIREKKSFTKNPTNEFASCGIYYFKSFKIFKHFGNKLMQKTKGEGYVSLIFNLMKKSKLNIDLFEVEKFICLGKPIDYRIFLYWIKYFKFNLGFKATKYFDTYNLIPMSGEGKRFKDYGYRVRKPLIEIKKKPMILNACETFPKSNNWNFIINKKDDQNNRVEKLIKNFHKDSKIIKVNKLTKGPAESCYLSKKNIDQNKPLFISSCDYITIFNENKWSELIKNKNIDGAIWTYKLDSIIVKSFNAFGYCKIKNKNSVAKIVEKKIISKSPINDQMIIGSFWFRKAKMFFDNCDEARKKNFLLNNEYYVGNNINLLLKKNFKFVIFEVDQWVSLGDPFEVKVFEYWEDIF